MKTLLAALAVSLVMVISPSAHAACPYDATTQSNALWWFYFQLPQGYSCSSQGQSPVGSNCTPTGGVTYRCTYGGTFPWKVTIGSNCGSSWIDSKVWEGDGGGGWDFYDTFRCTCGGGCAW